ncbi:MAG: LysR family transcriptional regulator [bacterium]|nr:LysR family transcriptional regulator [bacterium]
MNYTLHQLQVFAKVVQTKSITKAAIELHMSQPAASIQLKNLQNQFEIPLTEVIGRQLYVTDFGNEIYVMAERILNEVYAINYKTLSYKGYLTGRLLISSVSTGKYIIPFFLSDFLKQHDGIDLILDVTNKAKVIENLEKNEIDFALVSVLPENLQVNKEILLENSLHVIGMGRERNTKKPLDRKELEKMSFIFREVGSGTRSSMENYFNKYKIKFRKKLELTSNEAVKQAIIAGIGNSIMPIIGLKNELLNGDLKIIPTVGLPLKSNWYLIWLKNKKLSPVAEAYISFIKKSKEKILEHDFAWLKIIMKEK